MVSTIVVLDSGYHSILYAGIHNVLGIHMHIASHHQGRLLHAPLPLLDPESPWPGQGYYCLAVHGYASYLVLHS